MLDDAAGQFRPMALEMRHLRLILAIVTEGSLTRASETLNLTQSALSHQLRQLETSLGLALFIRARKRLVLTEAGQELVARAREIVNSVDALENDLRQRASGWRGALRISTECYTCYEWLPPLLKRFNRKHPNVDVTIVPEATSHPIEALRNGQIDVAIVTKADDRTGLTMHTLFGDEMLLIVPNEHRLARKPFVTPVDFEDERLMLYSPPPESLFCRQFFGGTPPGETTVIRLTEAMFSMVRAGLGVTVAARWAVASELTAGRLTGVQLGARGYHREWMAATNTQRGRETPRYVTDFVGLISEAAAPSRFAARAS